MNYFNITHTYVNEGASDLYIETSYNHEAVGGIIALVCFVAEQHIEDSVSVFEEFLVKVMVEIFGMKTVDNPPYSVNMDSYVERELRCGKWFNDNFDKYKDSTVSSKIRKLLDENPDMYNV